MTLPLNRRAWLAGAAAVTAAATVPTARAVEPAEPFGFCFNTSTVRGQKRPIAEVVDIVARAGYQAIEPWVDELDAHVKAGGSIRDLAKRCADQGLKVPDAIGFPRWVVDDEAERTKALDECKRIMGMLRELGCQRMAAPPVGMTDRPDLDLRKAADRYRVLLELGESMDVTPIVEMWGHSKSINRLGEAMLVAMESGHPKACVLPDIYHLHKGGSGFGGLKLLGPSSVGIFHVNDYPAEPGRANITDAHRVYPGDGVVPWKTVLRDLRASGYRGFLSLELFNRDYWKQDPQLVARTGLEKTKAVVAQALAG